MSRKATASELLTMLVLVSLTAALATVYNVQMPLPPCRRRCPPESTPIVVHDGLCRCIDQKGVLQEAPDEQRREADGKREPAASEK